MISGYPKAVVATGVGLILASAIGIAVALMQMRSDVIRDGVLEAENAAVLLSEQTAETVQSVELVLDSVISDIGRRSPSRLIRDQLCADRGGILPNVIARLGNISAAGSVTILGADGAMICTTISGGSSEANMSDRDYFQHGAASPDPGLFIGKPVVSKLSGAWVLVFSKRLAKPDGAFLGVVSLSLKIDSLSAMYVGMRSIHGEMISLARRDGTVILRYPDPTVRAGQMFPAGLPWYDMVAKGGGSYWSPGVFDGQPKYVAVRPLERYPLVVNVTSNESDILRPWRLRAITIGVLSVAIQAALALLLKALFRQVSKLRLSEASLRRTSSEAAVVNARFQAMLSNMSKGVAMFDAQGRIVIHNTKYREIWGAAEEDLKPGTPLSDLLEARAGQGVYVAPQRMLGLSDSPAQLPTFNEALNLTDGRSIRIVNDPMPDGGWVSTHEDITESQQANARIAHMAHHDVLTGLLNRSGFMSSLHERLSARSSDPFGILLVDLDRFKEVNDTFGHLVGDEVLCLVAARLAWAIETGDFVARLGGDEFAIYLPPRPEVERAAKALAERVVEAMSAPFKVGANVISIGVCVGIAATGGDSDDLQTILRSADLALYRAKSEGRNRYRLFEPAMEAEFQSRRALVKDLKVAIEADALQLFYQPIVDSESLEIRAMEALARWTHPLKGMISPAVFIPLAEEAGLINDLGAWALRRACRDALGWPGDVKVSVNVSGIQLSHPDFPGAVARILQETGLPAQRLEIEITESTLVSDAQHALSTLEAVKRLGVSVALDDFGTGYSSLSYLKMFPFDVIKIDKSFIDDMQTHRGCATIVAAIQSLARGFDMLVTAEGVETRNQFELLRVAGIPQIQGYLFGKPAPAANWDFSRPMIAA